MTGCVWYNKQTYEPQNFNPKFQPTIYIYIPSLPESSKYLGVWNPKRPSQEVFRDPSTYSQGIWKTRVYIYIKLLFIYIYLTYLDLPNRQKCLPFGGSLGRILAQVLHTKGRSRYIMSHRKNNLLHSVIPVV